MSDLEHQEFIVYGGESGLQVSVHLQAYKDRDVRYHVIEKKAFTEARDWLEKISIQNLGLLRLVQSQAEKITKLDQQLERAVDGLNDIGESFPDNYSPTTKELVYLGVYRGEIARKTREHIRRIGAKL